MPLQSSPVLSYRDDFSFRNSPAAIRRFPFPFIEDSYLYSVNIEPATSRDPGSVYEHAFDIDEHYRSEMAERALILDNDPRRYLVMPHMQAAAWDALQMLMENLAVDYPQWFSLVRDGDRWHWRNHLLQIDQPFIFGDAASLPCAPLEYIGRQVQGISPCSTSATATCTWTPAWSPARPTGHWRSMPG